MKKIEKLTKEQEALLSTYRDKWLKIGLCTKPSNKERGEHWIKEAYKVAGLTPPEKIIWCGSPLSAILTAKIVDKILKDPEAMKSVWDSVWASVWASVWDSVGASIRASIRASIWDSVGASVGASIRASIRASVWDSVGASVGASIRASVWDSVGASIRASIRASVGASVGASVWDSVGASVGASIRASVWDSVYSEAGFGQHDANWLGFYEYFNDALKLSKQVEKLIPLIRLAEDANWFYPYQNICFVSEKPEVCSVDERGLIHAEDGPAVKYKDGFSVYAINGIRMNGAEWVCDTDRENLDGKKIIEIKNVEQRLMAIKKVGIARVLKDLKSKVICKGKLPNGGGTHGDGIYKLHEVDLFGSKEKLFEMPNPSEDKRHYEFVDPGCETRFEADMWRRGFDNYKTKYEPTEIRA